MSDRITNDIQQCGHTWKRTGMFLMKMANTHTYRGDVSGRKVVGGLEGYWEHQTPEVEWCSLCGLLRIPVPTAEPPKKETV